MVGRHGFPCFNPLRDAPLRHELQAPYDWLSFAALDRANAESGNDKLIAETDVAVHDLGPEVTGDIGVSGALIGLPDGRLIGTDKHNLRATLIGNVFIPHRYARFKEGCEEGVSSLGG